MFIIDIKHLSTIQVSLKLAYFLSSYDSKIQEIILELVALRTYRFLAKYVR